MDLLEYRGCTALDNLIITETVLDEVGRPMPCAAKKSRQANAEPPSSTTTIDTINTASYGRRMHAWPPVRDPLNFDHWNR